MVQSLLRTSSPTQFEASGSSFHPLDMNSLWHPPSSFLEKINKIDSWPFFSKDPVGYAQKMSDFYYFMVDSYQIPFSYVHKSIIESREWPEYWTIDHNCRALILNGGNDFQSRTDRMNETVHLWESKQAPNDGNVWIPEQMPLLYPDTFEHVLDLDRSMIDVLGVIDLSVHLVAYVMTPEGIKFWVPRRAMTKRTFPGKLDNTVAGGLRSRERPFDCIVREAAEEASFPEEFTKKHIQSIGTVSYTTGMNVADNMPGCLNHLLYVYVMDVGEELTPTPFDGEVQDFTLMSAEKVVSALFNDEFKSLLLMTWTAVFIHLGIITAENEPNYAELCTRIHRRFEIFKLESLLQTPQISL